MVLHFTKKLSEALRSIEFNEEYYHLPVSLLEVKRIYSNSDEIVAKYGELKWKVVDLLNEKYGTHFDLGHWLQGEEKDEVAYFLNEAGSNALNHSEFKFPCAFQVWMGKKGFVVAVEQKGKGFNASLVDSLKSKTNEGKAFEFFRRCKSHVFFDDAVNAKMVLMEYVVHTEGYK